MQSIPREIVRALDAISNEVRLRIIKELYTGDELTFSELHNRLGIEKASLNFHLKKLTASGIAEHFYKHVFGDDRYSYYSLTEFGRRLIDGVMGSLVPHPPLMIGTPEVTSDNHVAVIENRETKLDLPTTTTAASEVSIEIFSRY